MGFAYEITPEDVFEVLAVHEMATESDDEIVHVAYATVQDVEDRVTEAVAIFGRDEPGRLVALREIEAILIEDGLIEGPEKLVV
jgi:hypothetical protein